MPLSLAFKVLLGLSSPLFDHSWPHAQPPCFCSSYSFPTSFIFQALSKAIRALAK